MAGFSNSKTPTIDGGLGLIIRLNILFNKADRASLSGDFEDWDHILDRVYCNLCYRNPMEVEMSKNGQVTKLELSGDDENVYHEFSKRIKNVLMFKQKAIREKNRRNLERAKQAHYWILIKKDIWLRKLMNELDLYIKEISFDPGSALFGG